MEDFRRYAAEIQDTLDRLPWEAVQATIRLLEDARSSDRQIFILGNGGSAATASHMACDLAKNTALVGQPKLRVAALTDNVALFSAYANDRGYDNAFAEQLSNLARRGDIVIAISTSGRSPNVLRGIKRAREAGAVTVGWTGEVGTALAEIVDVAVIVPNRCPDQIEDVHLMLEHMVTRVLRRVWASNISTLDNSLVSRRTSAPRTERARTMGKEGLQSRAAGDHARPRRCDQP